MHVIEVEKDAGVVANIIASYVLETNRYKFTYGELRSYARKAGFKVSDEVLWNALVTLTSLMFLKRMKYRVYVGRKFKDIEYFKLGDKFVLHVLFSYIFRA